MSLPRWTQWYIAKHNYRRLDKRWIKFYFGSSWGAKNFKESKMTFKIRPSYPQVKEPFFCIHLIVTKLTNICGLWSSKNMNEFRAYALVAVYVLIVVNMSHTEEQCGCLWLKINILLKVISFYFIFPASLEVCQSFILLVQLIRNIHVHLHHTHAHTDVFFCCLFYFILDV